MIHMRKEHPVMQYILKKQRQRAERRAEKIERLLTEYGIDANGKHWAQPNLRKKLKISRDEQGLETIRYDGILLWKGVV